jgi:hypothetical protein
VSDGFGLEPVARRSDTTNPDSRRAPHSPRTTSGDRQTSSRWRRPDPLVILVGAVAFVTYILHGFHGTLTRDLGLYSYAGQQVADGVPPYMEVLNRAGPLAHVFPAVGVIIARVGGFDDVVTMRVFFMLIAVVCACAVYILGRDVFSSRLAGLVTASAFLTFYGFIHYATNGPREKTPMTLFIVLALWAITKQRWFTAGLFISLATLCLQIAFFSSTAAVVAGVLLLAHGHRLRSLVRVALGGIVPVAVLTVWFALAGSLHQSIEAFYLINARYTVPNPVLDELDTAWLDARTAFGLSLWLLFGGLLALALRSLAVFSATARRKDPSLVLLAAFTVGAAVGLVWNLKDYDAWPDLFPMMPFAAVGIGGVFVLATRWLSERIATVAAAVLCLAAVVTAMHYAVSRSEDTLDAQRASVRAVMKQLPPDARITSIEAPQPLVLTGQTNRTRYQMFRGGLQYYIDDTWPGGRDGFRRDLVDKDAPALISVGDTVSDRWRAAIETEYVWIGGTEEWGWYARASLGPAKIAALRRAAGYDRDDDFAHPRSAE